MTIDEIIDLLNADPETTLTDLQEAILRLAWRKYSYRRMAEELHYRDSYLKNLARDLWPLLSKVFGVTIRKANFVQTLQYHSLTEGQAKLIRPVSPSRNLDPVPEPHHYGPLGLASPFYIERPPIEDLARAEIDRPGAVLRVRSPARTGKTSLLIRILHEARQKNYRTVTLNFERVEREILFDLDRFLRWFCTVIADQLNLEPEIARYWREDAGSKISCGRYLRDRLLARDESPLVLALDEVHRLFEYPPLIRDFFPLLRAWHEDSNVDPIWRRLRSIIVHSTDNYVPLGIDSSPFNLGLTLVLPEIPIAEVRTLAGRYGLDWSDKTGEEKAIALTRMIGGHPYLIQFTLYYLRRRGANLETILENAPTAKSIYIDHLRSLSLVFRECPELIPAWTRVIQSPVAVEIETVAAHRLESLGLIERVSGGVIAANQLYRLYFQQQFSLTGYTLALEDRIARLERENQRLLTLSLVDELTGIGSRTGFDRSLEREWGRSARLNTHLSLILCEIERDPTDPELDDDSPALSRIAGAIAASACRITDYTARYEESRFALLLPETLLSGALIVAERLRSRLENLEIARSDGTFSPPIVNIGIACRQADFETSADSLCTAAEGALEQARTTGENRISIAP